jgi:hypothetical protein
MHTHTNLQSPLTTVARPTMFTHTSLHSIALLLVRAFLALQAHAEGFHPARRPGTASRESSPEADQYLAENGCRENIGT